MINPWNSLAEDCRKADIAKHLCDIFRNQWQFEDMLARSRQVRAAQVNHRVGRRFMGRGIGEVKMSVDAKFYMDMVALYGPDCWKDKSFRKSVLKKNPECRVVSRPDNLTVRVEKKAPTSPVVAAGSPRSEETKFKKKYL